MPSQISRPWTSEELVFLEKNIHKLTYKQMGLYIQRTPTAIQSKIRYLPFQQKIKKHPVNSHFFKTWSANMAYVLGFIAADGNICHSGRGYTLHIACDDKDVIEKIKLVMDYRGPIHLKPRFNSKISYSLRICDPIIFQDLMQLNITERKSLTLIPPKVPQELVVHYIRGFFDGDGSVYLTNHKYPRKLNAVFCTASLAMANYIFSFLKDLLGENYAGNIHHSLAHKKTPFFNIKLKHKASVQLFQCMYTENSIYSDRKYRKFIEGMSYVT
jgi:hypothetical protein